MARKRNRKPTGKAIPAVAYEAVDTPAKIHRGHVRDRHLTAIAGGPVAWRNTSEHPLQAAFDANRIESDEFAAGEVYRTLFEKMARTGRDSTQLAIVAGGSGVPFTDAQVSAIRLIEHIEGKLPKGGMNWPQIIRLFCGEGWSASEACKKAGVRDPKKTWITMRLALSKLSVAIQGTRV